MSENAHAVGERALELLVEYGYGPKREIDGCTDEELAQLEAEFDVELPDAYKSCLRHIGRRTNGFLRGSEFTYPAPKYQRDFLEDCIERWDLDASLEETEFVFRGLQGSAFWVFDTEEGDDPPVYRYQEDATPQLVADTFSEWLYSEISDEREPHD
ncbi:SMI1/KNR4 family protein [Halopiger goleimassiliensis]|uniref:SMI1/KNR4 family protein n=1 Tax=Halopiger goleimassiliensis TaxID=1293048 RepID=UPI000677CBF1|nr:SMI1/KNR4 family protein [Halopiger goleimassiliensis]